MTKSKTKKAVKPVAKVAAKGKKVIKIKEAVKPAKAKKQVKPVLKTKTKAKLTVRKKSL